VVEARLVDDGIVMVEILVVVTVLALLPCDEDEDAWLEDGEDERLEEEETRELELLPCDEDEDAWLEDGEEERLEVVEARLVDDGIVMVEILVVVTVLALLPCDEDEEEWLEEEDERTGVDEAEEERLEEEDERTGVDEADDE